MPTEQLTILHYPTGWVLLDEALYQLAEFPTEAAAVAAAERRARLLGQRRYLVIHDGDRWAESEIQPCRLSA